jgi:hypothetical protein
MRPLSALDAITPAWDHTYRLLVAPRRWSTALKVGFVAVFAGIGGGFNTGSFNNNNFNKLGNHHLPTQWTTEATAILAAIAAVAVVLFAFFFLVWLVFFYIGSRLQFVLFEIVLRRDTEIAPIWRRYGPATWRWMGLRLIFVVAAFLCIAPIVIPAAIHLYHSLPQAGGPPPDIASLLGTFFAVFATVFVVAIVFGIINILVHDFGLPSMALESTTIGTTLHRVFALVRAEPGQSALYLLMRFVMGIAGSIAAAMAIGIIAFIAALPFTAVGLILFFSLHHASMALAIACVVILGIGYIAFLFCVVVTLTGFYIAFLQAYALYFLGGRYPAVGQYLAPFWPATHVDPIPPPAYSPVQA